ncbi:MAG: hypothetical protein LUG12_07410 [Erysipelotrichaceae bacterium]|nr:hypothetical protein [Erysipelotrichaceae bacterium]
MYVVSFGVDLSILMELSECYHIDIIEILNGKRNSVEINDAIETLKTVSV